MGQERVCPQHHREKFIIDMKRAGVFGPSLCGKTTLVRELSREYWRKNQIKSLILDPHGEEWHNGAIVTADEEKFWEQVWASRNCLIVVEEAAATIRRERDLVPVFTRMRHLQHKLIVVGHSGADLLPVMRQQFDTLYLFRQPESSAKVWAEVFTDKTLLKSVELKQYEFIQAEMFKTPVRRILQFPSAKKVRPA